MTITISLPDEIAIKLHERASASGETISEYTSRLVQQAVNAPTLEELLAPVQEDFARSKMTEREFLEFGQNLVNKVLAGKQA